MSGKTHASSHPTSARLHRAAAALVAAGAVAALAGPATAGAATISTGSGSPTGPENRLIYIADSAENNDLVISQALNAKGLAEITYDDVVPITIKDASGICQHRTAGDTTKVTCNPDAFPTDQFARADASLGNGNNRLHSGATLLPVNASGLGATTNLFVTGGGNDTLLGGAGKDFLHGGAGNDGLAGLAGGDDIHGDSGKDNLLGGDGDDRLQGGTGADVLQGQAGFDTALYDDRVTPVKVTIDDFANDGEVGEGDRVLADVENVFGGRVNDEFIDLAGRANAFHGGPGNDRLDGGAGRDTLYGETGDDRLDGGTDTDLLLGGDHVDVLVGGAGADDIRGGFGLGDRVDYGGSPQPVAVDLDGAIGDDGAAGEGDTVRADVERIFGSLFSDTLTGNALANQIAGQAGDDRLQGGGDGDTMNGGPGRDEISGGLGRDLVHYFERTEPVTVDADSVAFDDGAAGEGDTIMSDVEDLIGGAGADTLTGNAGANRILGSGGNDVIEGGLGSDELFGESGNDTIDSKDGALDSVNCGADSDQVRADVSDTQTDCEAPAAPAVGIVPRRARIDKRGG